MLRQVDNSSPAALVVAPRGTAFIHIRTGAQGTMSSNSTKEDLGQLVKVLGEGRMLTGAPAANASIVAGKDGVNAIVLRVLDWVKRTQHLRHSRLPTRMPT